MKALSADAKVISEENPAAQACTAGHLVAAQTDDGSAVNVWRPADTATDQHRFFCHGHSTLDWYWHGYSLPGESLEVVLRKEWTRITKKPMKGDIVVWRTATGEIEHSARIERAVHAFGKSTELTLSTKNGQTAQLLTGQTIEQVEARYPTSTWKPRSGCLGSVEKQYYRRNDRQLGMDVSFP